MPVGAFVPSRIHIDYSEWAAPSGGDTGKVWAYTGSGYAPMSLNFDPAGTAAAAVAAHVALSDPHTQYALESALGTAAALNVGTSANNIVQLDGSAKLPAVDGSQLTAVTVAAAGSNTQVIYNNAGVYAGHTGMTYSSANSRLTVAGGLVAPSMRPASDSTTALQVKTTAGTSVLTVDTTNGYLYLPDPTATTRLQLRPTGLYLTTNSGTSINSFVMSGLETTIDSRSTLHMKTNGVTWLSGGTAGLAFVAATISFSDSAGGINMVGALLRGSNHLGLQAADNRFTVTVKQNSNASGTADILQVQTQSGGAALYVDVNGYVAIGQSSAAALLDLAASTTSSASLRIRAGTAPTSPNAGDIYFNGTNFFGYNGSAWKQLDN